MATTILSASPKRKLDLQDETDFPNPSPKASSDAPFVGSSYRISCKYGKIDFSAINSLIKSDNATVRKLQKDKMNKKNNKIKEVKIEDLIDKDDDDDESDCDEDCVINRLLEPSLKLVHQVYWMPKSAEPLNVTSDGGMIEVVVNTNHDLIVYYYDPYPVDGKHPEDINVAPSLPVPSAFASVQAVCLSKYGDPDDSFGHNSENNGYEGYLAREWQLPNPCLVYKVKHSDGETFLSLRKREDMPKFHVFKLPSEFNYSCMVSCMCADAVGNCVISFQRGNMSDGYCEVIYVISRKGGVHRLIEFEGGLVHAMCVDWRGNIILVGEFLADVKKTGVATFDAIVVLNTGGSSNPPDWDTLAYRTEYPTHTNDD
jgi:hypothetical protein